MGRVNAKNARPRVIRGTRTALLPLLPSGPGGVCSRPLHGARDLTSIHRNMRGSVGDLVAGVFPAGSPTSRHRAETVRNPAAQQTSRMAGLPNAKFKMAPIIASPAATGRMRLAVYVHRPASTSAVANFVPEFHPCSKA